MTSNKERKKALIAEYRKRPKIMGAYCIRNVKNQRRFVGVSRDIDARFNRHRFALNTNTENLSADLQQDWNDLGPEAFTFEVLDTIEPPGAPPDEPHEGAQYDPTEDLEVLQQLWFEQLQPFSPGGYNKPD